MEGREVVNVRYMQRKRSLTDSPAARQRAPIDCCYAGAAGSKAIDVKDKREGKTSRLL